MTERSVVVLSGSTRAASTNTAFARTAAAHPPAGTTVTAWTALTGLPHFDPDLDRDPLPAPVAALRDLLSGADAVVLCTPEYAGALPGAFKNALDWTVGSTVFSDKPVAWIKVAADARRGEGAHAELATVLGYVQARVLPQACTHVPIDRNAVNAEGLIADETIVKAVSGALEPQSRPPSTRPTLSRGSRSVAGRPAQVTRTSVGRRGRDCLGGPCRLAAALPAQERARRAAAGGRRRRRGRPG